MFRYKISEGGTPNLLMGADSLRETFKRSSGVAYGRILSRHSDTRYGSVLALGQRTVGPALTCN